MTVDLASETQRWHDKIDGAWCGRCLFFAGTVGEERSDGRPPKLNGWCLRRSPEIRRTNDYEFTHAVWPKISGGWCGEFVPGFSESSADAENPAEADPHDAGATTGLSTEADLPKEGATDATG